MKPTKSRVMCPDCGRQKMLFKTEKEAKTFLKFNEEAVNPDGTREMRTYYCPACCGYHISSHKYAGDNKKTDRMIEKYREETDGGIKAASELYEQLEMQKFITRKAVNKWLREQGYSSSAKDIARLRYYKEHKI